MSEQADATPSEDFGGFLGRHHHRLRFNELPETLLARIIATKCTDLSSKEVVCIQLSLQDLFRKLSASEIENKLADVTFTYSEKNTELFADFLSTILGANLEPHHETEAALDFYHSHVESRLKWLRSGEEKDGKLPCIEGFTKRKGANTDADAKLSGQLDGKVGQVIGGSGSELSVKVDSSGQGKYVITITQPVILATLTKRQPSAGHLGPNDVKSWATDTISSGKFTIEP
jgi:hypothetical protein